MLIPPGVPSGPHVEFIRPGESELWESPGERVEPPSPGERELGNNRGVEVGVAVGTSLRKTGGERDTGIDGRREDGRSEFEYSSFISSLGNPLVFWTAARAGEDDEIFGGMLASAGLSGLGEDCQLAAEACPPPHIPCHACGSPLRVV